MKYTIILEYNRTKYPLLSTFVGGGRALERGGIFLLMNGAQAVLESLRRENVEVIFGYPGGAVLDLYDALY